MGFLDFTPKKISILSDATEQVELNVGKGIVEPHLVEDFSLSSGETVALFAMNYGKAYRNAIEAISAKHNMIIINTPLTDDGIAIERKRSATFF